MPQGVSKMVVWSCLSQISKFKTGLLEYYCVCLHSMICPIFIHVNPYFVVDKSHIIPVTSPQSIDAVNFSSSTANVIYKSGLTSKISRTDISMERSTMFTGKIHYSIHGHFQYLRWMQEILHQMVSTILLVVQDCLHLQ